MVKLGVVNLLGCLEGLRLCEEDQRIRSLEVKRLVVFLLLINYKFERVVEFFFVFVFVLLRVGSDYIVFCDLCCEWFGGYVYF